MKFANNRLTLVLGIGLTALFGCSSRSRTPVVDTYREIPAVVTQPDVPYRTDAICYVPTFSNLQDETRALRACLRAEGFTVYDETSFQKRDFKSPDFIIELLRTRTFVENYQKGYALYGKVYVNVRRPHDILNPLVAFLGQDARLFQALSRTLLPTQKIPHDAQQQALEQALKNLMGNPRFRAALDPSQAIQITTVEVVEVAQPTGETNHAAIERLCNGKWTAQFNGRTSLPGGMALPQQTSIIKTSQFLPNGTLLQTTYPIGSPHLAQTFTCSYTCQDDFLTLNFNGDKTLYRLIWRDINTFECRIADPVLASKAASKIAPTTIKVDENGVTTTITQTEMGSITTVIEPEIFTCENKLPLTTPTNHLMPPPTGIAVTPPSPKDSQPSSTIVVEAQRTEPQAMPPQPQAASSCDTTLLRGVWQAQQTLTFTPHGHHRVTKKQSIVERLTFSEEGTFTRLIVDQSSGKRFSSCGTYTFDAKTLSLSQEGQTLTFRLRLQGNTFELQATDAQAHLKAYPFLSPATSSSLAEDGVLMLSTQEGVGRLPPAHFKRKK